MLFTVLGVILVLIEIYFPKFADKLQHFLINLPDFIMPFFTNLFLYKGKSRFGIILIVASFIVLSSLFISVYGPSKYSDNAMSVFEVFLWIPAFFAFVILWGAIAPWVFKMFDYITKNKAFVGIGVLIIILSSIR